MKKISETKDPYPSKPQKGEEEAPKRQITLFDKVKRRINATRLIFGVISVLLYTAFTIIMMLRNWGSTVYLSIILGFVGLYILLFAVVLILQRKSRAKFSNSLKNYKSGLKILKSFLVLLNFGLTISIFIQAAGTRDIGTPFQVAVLIVTLTWALFQIVFQATRMYKRHKAFKKRKAEKTRKKQV